MARRSDHSREELYEMALSAAHSIVDDDGLRALTARNVADAIGYSPGTLYNLFENLDGLIVHLNGRTLDRLHEQLSATTMSEAPEDTMMSLLDSYLQFLEAHPGLWHVLFEYTLPAGEQLPTWYLLKVSKVLGLVEQALTPIFTDAEDIRIAQNARTIWASLHGICSLSDAGKLEVVSSQSVREMAEGMVLNFITGLKVNHGRTQR